MKWSEPRKTPRGLVRSAYPTPEFFKHQKAFEKAGCVLKNGVVHHWAIDGEFVNPIILVFVNEKISTEPMDGAPLCIDGAMIWMNHDVNWITGRCKKCKWQAIPSLI